MTHILKTDPFFLLSNLLSSKSVYLTQSTPGFKTLKLQDHQHYTDFKNKALQQNKINYSTKNGRC